MTSAWQLASTRLMSAARVRLVVHDQHLDARQIDAAAYRASTFSAWSGARDVSAANRRQRQRHDERGALVFAAALGPDGAAVQLDEVLDDGQAQAQPAVVARRGGVGLAEALEDHRQELGLDADARVADGDLQVRIDRAPAARRRRPPWA